MNRQQAAYALATARLKTVEAALDEANRVYMEERQVIDPDTNAAVTRIWHVTWDDTLFDTLNDGFYEEHKALNDEWTAATIAKNDAEDALIEFGLSLAPAGVRETLADGVKHVAHIRKQFIDATFRLDTRTIQGGRLHG